MKQSGNACCLVIRVLFVSALVFVMCPCCVHAPALPAASQGPSAGGPLSPWRRPWPAARCTAVQRLREKYCAVLQRVVHSRPNSHLSICCCQGNPCRLLPALLDVPMPCKPNAGWCLASWPCNLAQIWHSPGIPAGARSPSAAPRAGQQNLGCGEGGPPEVCNKK
jgi:hypothetical protein